MSETLQGIEKDLEKLEAGAEGIIDKINLKAKRTPWVFVSGFSAVFLAIGLAI